MRFVWYLIISSMVLFKYNSGQTVQDIDGNVYKTIIIGKQCWMAENLKTTKYNDGIPINEIISNSEWTNLDANCQSCFNNQIKHMVAKPGYCWYNNDSSRYKKIYGALYNWYAVNDSHKLCPSGWHVTTANDWIELCSFVGGRKKAGGKLKETGKSHWEEPNNSIYSEQQFNALPAGYRFGITPAEFTKLGYIAIFWSNTEIKTHQILRKNNLQNTPHAWTISFYNNSKKAYYQGYLKKSGYSVRCIKD